MKILIKLVFCLIILFGLGCTKKVFLSDMINNVKTNEIIKTIIIADSITNCKMKYNTLYFKNNNITEQDVVHLCTDKNYKCVKNGLQKMFGMIDESVCYIFLFENYDITEPSNVIINSNKLKGIITFSRVGSDFICKIYKINNNSIQIINKLTTIINGISTACNIINFIYTDTLSSKSEFRMLLYVFKSDEMNTLVSATNVYKQNLLLKKYLEGKHNE